MARLRHGAVGDDLKAPNADKIRQVRRDELPLHCPPPDSFLWNSHPKVYLPIEKTGRAVCPYCSASYVLVDGGTA